MICRYKKWAENTIVHCDTFSLYLIASLENLVISSSHITVDFWWFVAKQHKLSQNKAYFALLSLLLFASGAALYIIYIIFCPKKDLQQRRTLLTEGRPLRLSVIVMVRNDF